MSTTPTKSPGPPLTLFLARRGKDVASAGSDIKVDDSISDVDARVLRSILEEGKVDISTEKELRQLLEKPIVPTRTPSDSVTEGQEEEDESLYTSSIIKTFTNTKLWRSLMAKRDEVLESARIFVRNRVERDTKTVAALGVFAWNRARKDLFLRLLPASGRTFKRIVFALANSTSTMDESGAENTPRNFLLSATSSWQTAQEEEERQRRTQDFSTEELFEELNTPLEEIQSVTASIWEILTGGGGGGDKDAADDDVYGSSVAASTTTTTATSTPSSASSSTLNAGAAAANKRGLKSVAPAGTSRNAERLRRAYQRRKETVLKREQEGPMGQVGQAATAVTDAAWELKQELQAEGNTPGYRSESARATARDVTKAALLGAGVKKSSLESLPMGIGSMFAASPVERVVGTDDLDFLPSATPPVITWTDVLQERERLASVLRHCLQRPSETWLRPGTATVDNEGDASEQTLQDVVTAMICARNDFETTEGEEEEGPTDASEAVRVMDELQRMEGTLSSIVSLAAMAAGKEAAELLQKELIPSMENEQEFRPLIAMVDDIMAGKVSIGPRKQEEASAEATNDVAFGVEAPESVMEDEEDASVLQTVEEEEETVDQFTASAVVVEENDDKYMDAQVVTVEVEQPVVTTVPETAKFAKADTVWQTTTSTVVVEEQVKIPPQDEETQQQQQQQVEIVTDEDYEKITNVKKTNAAVLSGAAAADGENGEMAKEEEEEVEEEEESLLVKATLRALDITFFVLEKAVTVGVPTAVSTGKRVSSRVEQVQRGGLGSKGWKVLRNAKGTTKRY